MVRESSSSGIRDVRGGVAPRTGFFGVYWDGVMLHTCFFLGHDAPRMGPNLEVAHCFWAGPHNSPSKLRFLSPSEEKSGVLMFGRGWK